MNADQPKSDKPRSLAEFDLGGEENIGALTFSQQSSLNLHKVNIIRFLNDFAGSNEIRK